MSLIAKEVRCEPLRNRGITRVEIERERKGKVGAKPKNIVIDIDEQVKINLYRNGRFVGKLFIKNEGLVWDCDMSVGVYERFVVRTNDDNARTYTNKYGNIVTEFNDDIVKITRDAFFSLFEYRDW